MDEKLKSEENPAVEESADERGEEKAPADKESNFESQLAEANERYLRLLAEFENYKKRTSREYERQVEAANDRLIIRLLDVVDNFDRALNVTEKLRNEGDNDTSKLFVSLHDGARMIHQQLTDILKTHGVEEIKAEGQPFDPQEHEAILQIESQEHPEDHVVQVVSKGYKKGDRVIRHARVGVSKPTE